MSIREKEEMRRKLGYFEQSGMDKKRYALILAAYYDRLDTALNLIETDPDQINRQDPHSGLTALHIAIFRQNRVLAQCLATHPMTDVHIQDVFNRKAVDMLDYCSDQAIFEVMLDVTFSDSMRELEQFAFGNEEPTQGNVVPLKPKAP